MPRLLLLLGGLLAVLFAVFRYSKRTHVKVNCWFCGLNSVILKKCQDGWMCRHCEQYNGFKPDGDYNRDIPAQWDSSLNGKVSFCAGPGAVNKSDSNGLCQDCNRNQEMKIAQLASFQPINPENFDDEIENFSYHLERAYRLCPPCESVLEDTLSRKKTHVLGINLQMTGKNNFGGNYPPAKDMLSRILLQTCVLTSLAMGLMLAVFKLSTPFFVSDIYSPSLEDNGVSSCHKPHVFLMPDTCAWEKARATPEFGTFSSLIYGCLKPYILSAELHLLLCLCGMALQAVSTWNSGSRLSLHLWASLAATMFTQHNELLSVDYAQITKIFQVTLLVLILVCPWIESFRRTSPPIKKFSNRGSERRKMKRDKICNPGSVSSSLVGGSTGASQMPQVPVHPVLPKLPSSEEMRQDKITLKAPNYMALPARAASVLSVHSLTSAAALNKSLSTSSLPQCIVTQEDARSDASVDSAFSNTDSITLDGAESLNSSSQCGLGKKKDPDDGDVHSLIGGLSIGSFSGRQSLKKTAEFKKTQYLGSHSRGSLLSPSRLTNVVNESMRGGSWCSTKSSVQSVPDLSESFHRSVSEPLNESVTKSLNLSLSRPGSPSVVLSAPSPRSFSPPLSFQQCALGWNAPVLPHRALSVCLPPVSGFGNVAPPPPTNTPISQVIYTPYGAYHQMISPFGNAGMYMMPPQSPAFGGSPTSSYGSQFSPRTFSTSSHKDVSFCDSDNDFSPKSSKGGPRKKPSSFFQSVWQSRFAIMYTTLCYLLLGSFLCAVSYSGVASKIIYKVLNWKQSVLSSIS